MDRQDDGSTAGTIRDVVLRLGDGPKSRDWIVQARTPSDGVQISTATILKQMEDNEVDGEEFIELAGLLKRAVRNLIVDPGDWRLIERRLLDDNDGLDFFELVSKVVFQDGPANREQRRAEARQERTSGSANRQRRDGGGNRGGRGGHGRRH